MSSSEYIAVVPFSALLVLLQEDEPENFVCLDENRTWNEVDWGKNNLFPKELNGWILNKVSKNLVGIRDGYDLYYWEYSKNDKTVGWIDGEEDDYYLFSNERESLLLFLQDYSLAKNIRTNAEVQQYF